MKFLTPFTLLFTLAVFAQAQTGPEVTSWIINTTGATGFNNIPSNVQQVQYSAANVYVSCTSIPDYSIGPWPGNPNTPVNKNFLYKITRQPQQNTGTPIATPLGHTGVWSNGVSIFNARDAQSYQNQNVWHQNAVVVEGPGFDNCLGHPAPGGEYHHHLNPTCLYNDEDSLNHSPIIGYAFDGFPIYGAYGYVGTTGTGPVTRMRSSYQYRNITTRTTLPNGTPLSPNQYGPPVTATHPLGYYIEDYEYVAGSGDLDEHNGRFTVTPDYPAGTYAYFVTLDASLNAAYPYTTGPTYYGTVQLGNTGPGSGHVIITEPVTTYSVTGFAKELEAPGMELYPNPASESLMLYVKPGYHNNLTATLTTLTGQVLFEQTNLQPTASYPFTVSQLVPGVYLMKLKGEAGTTVHKVVVR